VWGAYEQDIPVLVLSGTVADGGAGQLRRREDARPMEFRYSPLVGLQY